LRHFDRANADCDRTLAPDFWDEPVIGATASFLHDRASTIYGGTTEVQKNIIAKIAFGF
jgi:alkylation response protein AidB-like acyl-CoA dehydrogenase